MRTVGCIPCTIFLVRRAHPTRLNQALGSLSTVVYVRCMSRTNVNIDDEACAEIMRRYRLTSKREAINLALRALAAEPLDVDEAKQLRGSGWDGDLDEMRSGRPT